MSNNKTTNTPVKKSFLEHAEFYLKLLGASAILTAIMGFPAVSLHYEAYGIPADLVSTDTAIRAGIQPAITFMLIFGYLSYVRSACLKSLEAKENTYYTPLFLFHVIPLAVAAILIRISGICSGVYLVLWWILSALSINTEPYGFLFWILAGVSLPIGIGLYLVTISIIRKIFQPKFDLGEEVEEGDEVKVNYDDWQMKVLMIYTRLADYLEFVKNFIAIYFIYFFISHIEPGIANWISVPAMLVVASFLALASVLVGVGIAMIKGVPDIGLGNLHTYTGFVVFAALLAVLFYSVDIYPSLSKSLGGGQPDVVDIWVDKSAGPVLANWSNTQSDGSHFHLTSSYLVRLDSDVAILVDKINPPAKWVVIDRKAVTSLSQYKKN